ncbi:MAG: hypothetical protein ACUVRZ_07805 [Desulfobacca sp.]|uniref:hypothetical protein n=1 Tax=Desulfobacca sp. TaxID=2067990 RepID=UPI004049F298
MTLLFAFAIRLLFAFFAAKLLLGLLGSGSPALLLALALALTGLTYLISWLERGYERTWQSKAAELGWRLARFLIGLNQIKDQRGRPAKK